jgi:hypothetical protein
MRGERKNESSNNILLRERGVEREQCIKMVPQNKKAREERKGMTRYNKKNIAHGVAKENTQAPVPSHQEKSSGK